jgi:hypothetical protein
MADPKSIAGEIEGDYAQVKIQLTGGGTDEKVKRPTKGTQVVWGGDGPSSPWGHLAALIEKAGGIVAYTFVHASDFKELASHAKEEDAPPEEHPAEEEHKPAGQPSEPAQHHPGGVEGSGLLFERGVDFPFDGNTARVWAHPHCFFSGPRPLLIFLHGINRDAKEKYPVLSDNGVHVGKLAAKLIDDGKVTPMAIVAPTEFKGGGKEAVWAGFSVARMVDAAVKILAPLNVQVDLDQVSVVGHSGAGGYGGAGLLKIAGQHAEFDGHKLKVFGVTDTETANSEAAAYAAGLKDNKTTVIYAMHKENGGWGQKFYAGAEQFAKALGATDKGKPEGAEHEDEVKDLHGGGSPLRVSMKIDVARGLNARHKDWKDAHAWVQRGSHWDMVPKWIEYALPRFYPATEEDKHAGAQPHVAPPAPVDPTPEPQITGGEWADVPKGPPIWTPPGNEPKDFAPAPFAPTTGFYWPVRNPKLQEGRAVCYTGQGGKGYWEGRGFFAKRPAKPPYNRMHVGIDVFGNEGDIVVACEAGKIVAFYPFYPNYPKTPLVSCMLVFSEKSGMTVNYGEVRHDSMDHFRLKVGDTVAPGQPIALVGKMEVDHMLHFETYPGLVKRNISFYTDPPAGKPKGDLKHYFNPTSYLMSLAKAGK